MRIVKISELSEEQKKKIKERQQERQRISEQNRISINNQFNKLIAQKGEYNKTNKTSLWDNIKNIANNGKYIAKKTGAGAVSGTAGIAQGQLTDMSNSARNGEQKNGVRLASDLLNALTGLSNPTGNITKSAPKQITKSIKTVFAKDKNALQKITALGMDAVTDSTNNLGIKNVSDAMLGIAGKINNNLDEDILDINNKLSEPINKMNLELEEEGKQYGAVTNTLANVGQAVGNMVPAIAATTITKNPQVGLATMGLSAKGQSTQDALNKGSELNEAVKIGNTKAMIEVGTEMLTGGVNIFGKGALDDIIEKGIVKKVKNNVAQFLVKQGANAFGEVSEETISDILGTAIDKGTIDPNAKYTLKDWGNTALTTVLTTFVLNTITGGMVNDIKQIKSENQAEKNAQHWLQEAENIIQENNTAKLPPQSIQNTQNTPSQQVMPLRKENAQKGNIKQQTILPMQNYIYEKSDNVKVDKFRQSASQNFDNSIESRNYLNMLEKIITDKDVDIIFDANLKDSQGRVANGSYSNGVITINPNSNRAGEFIAIHELTHAIGTNQMRNIVEQYRKSNKGFDSAVQQLLKNYNTTELTEEAMADVSAQLFGNQEFINTLAQREPSLFRKIYNEIKYLWHQFTGYKNQNQFIEDLQYKWEQAYRNNTKLNETTNYYIEPVAKFNEIEYNNVIEEKLGKKEYAILRSIINSDSNIKPGINYVEVTNGRYTVYYKGFDDFKVISRKVDADAGRINKRNDTTGRKTRYSKTFEQSIGNEGTTASDDEVSNFNTSGTRERSGSNTSSSTNIENGIKLPTKESENNSGSFILPKLKEGYIRLYRGLENEYDANYDKSKLDNSNGYESWTDDYELAKAYGDNVYYIDVPSSEVKNSIIDEDSQSETYGDRNLLYKNDKPVGIKGKSGNEYMLYTDHDNYSNLKYNKVDNNNSVKDNQGRALSKEQQEYFKDSKVRDENGNLLTMYHGTPNGDYTVFKDGTYFSPRKEYADGYQNTWASAISTKQNANNPKTYEVYLNITNPFTLQNPKAKSIYLNEFIKGGNSLSYDPYTDWTNDINNLDEIDWTEAEDLREWLVENHPEYDGLILDEGGDGGYGEAEYRWRGKSFVPFNANQIKNVDNTNPTDNPDIRYSLPTKEWQQYLDENYKPTGTRTNLQDIRIPVKENSQKSSFNLPTKQNTIKLPQKETNVDKYNRYKQNILKGRAEEVNNLIKNKNETINAIEQQIKEKKQLLNNKKDKTTKVANTLKMQIENLEQRKSKIENEYNSRIDRKFDKVTKDKINLATKKELGTTRKEIQQNLLENTGILNESLDNAQNISMVNMNRTDPIRLQEKVFGKELGTKINDMFFNKIKHNTAEKTRFLNSERSEIKNWGIKARSFESEVLQKYTEKTYVTEDGNEMSYTEADLIKDVPNEETRNKIKKASEELRKKYDNYIETANEVLVGLGYDAIPKRKDYVRHFTELNDIFTKFGIPGKLDNALPTDINGITDTFRPGKNFFANAQKRHGNKTTYDAITGIDGYIDGISNLIYHTEDIQRLRTLDKYIRESYGEKGFENLESLSEEERNTRIQKISENHLSNYVSWLTEYTNNLAGKKSGIDRSVEKLLGRNVYSALDTIKKQTGSNMTGFNIGSALTNFISVTQGASKTKKLALLKGTASTIQNIFNNDGFVDKSDFLTNRFGSDRISNTLWQKVSNVGQVFMSATDYFSSNLIVRSKYYENLAKGMSEVEALKNADDFGARILGDRSQGSTANVFNSKMLGILTQFQLEVNNQMDTMIHDTVQDFKTIEGERGSLKASMGAVWTLGQMAAYQYIFNNIFQAIAGRRPAFDVIDILKTALGIDDEDEEDSVKDNLQEAAIKLIEGLPFLNLLSEDARVPIASAIPNPISVATGDSTLKDEVSKLVYLLPPTGGSQAKKTIDGVKTVMDGGSYVINSKGEKELRFPVEDKNALSYIKAGTLGKYSLPLAQEYVDRDYKRLSAKQTKTYEESKVPFKEYLEYIEAGLKTNEDKINYLESKEMNTEQKWGIYTNDLFSSTERKEDGGSQLSDAKYITSNGVSKSEYIKIYNKAQKNNIDMPTAKEYKEMKANNVTLKNYIEYKVKVKEVTESKRKSKELSSTENLKNADKIQILLDLNYSDKEISGIYANYIKSEKDTEYDIMKATGINIKEYLKYKQQEFTSDKTDDGTLAGKTVNKSKQKKVVEYLNSNIKNGNQRLLLYAMQGYTTTSNQKTQLANYVNGLKLDKNTKFKLYDKFSGFTVYKDGTIKY